MGIFSPSTGQAEVIINVDARPLIKPLRPLDLATPLESYAQDEDTLTIFCKV